MEIDPRTGLFSSSLVKHQTSDHETVEPRPRADRRSWSAQERERRRDDQAFRQQPANDIETSFRHGFWIEDRDRVRAALVAANVPTSRVERFDGCGSNCHVQFSPSLNKHRVRANYCGDRFCLPCCASRAKKVQAAMEEWCQGQTVRFMTFTLKRTDEPLQKILLHLVASFKRLRAQKFWKPRVRAGTAVVEITRGAAGDHWHVHLHVLAVGTFIDQRELSDGWSKASGGSKIVDVRAVRDHKVGVAYVAKYATKGWSADVLANPEALLECLCALRGQRLLITFGEWYDRKHQLCKAEATDWKMVGWIRNIYRDSLEGKPWAIGVLRSLGIAAGEVAGQPTFLGVPQTWSGP